MNGRVRIEKGESEVVGGDGTQEPEAIHLPNDLWSQCIMARNATRDHTLPVVSTSNALVKVGLGVPLSSLMCLKVSYIVK